jgi:hypothetical protein
VSPTLKRVTKPVFKGGKQSNGVFIAEVSVGVMISYQQHYHQQHYHHTCFTTPSPTTAAPTKSVIMCGCECAGVRVHTGGVYTINHDAVL